MQALLAQLALQFSALSPLEMTAALLAIAYLALAIRQNIWCWLCAAVSTGIYVYLFFDARLYMESLLNGFYVVMAAYGWQVWRSGANDTIELPVTEWPLHVHVRAVLAMLALSAISGYLLQRLTDAALPYIDSLTTFAAIWATFLVARKVLSNWWYWLAIDAASVFIYWARDLPVTALLFMIYLAMIPFGLVAWRRSFRERDPELTSP
jgi:nicotinamide mononucleotide transporter